MEGDQSGRANKLACPGDRERKGLYFPYSSLRVVFTSASPYPPERAAGQQGWPAVERHTALSNRQHRQNTPRLSLGDMSTETLPGDVHLHHPSQTQHSNSMDVGAPPPEGTALVTPVESERTPPRDVSADVVKPRTYFVRGLLFCIAERRTNRFGSNYLTLNFVVPEMCCPRPASGTLCCNQPGTIRTTNPVWSPPPCPSQVCYLPPPRSAISLLPGLLSPRRYVVATTPPIPLRKNGSLHTPPLDT